MVRDLPTEHLHADGAAAGGPRGAGPEGGDGAGADGRGAPLRKGNLAGEWPRVGAVAEGGEAAARAVALGGEHQGTASRETGPGPVSATVSPSRFLRSQTLSGVSPSSA